MNSLFFSLLHQQVPETEDDESVPKKFNDDASASASCQSNEEEDQFGCPDQRLTFQLLLRRIWQRPMSFHREREKLRAKCSENINLKSYVVH